MRLSRRFKRSSDLRPASKNSCLALTIALSDAQLYKLSVQLYNCLWDLYNSPAAIVQQPEKGRGPLMTKPIPDGYSTIIPHLVVEGAGDAADFYGRAFGAEEVVRVPGAEDKLLHVELRVSGGVLFLCDQQSQTAKSPKQLGGSPTSLCLYVKDVDAAFKQAIEAGATERLAPADTFWGERYAQVEDPFGHCWSLSSRIEELTPEQIAKRAAEFTGDASST